MTTLLRPYPYSASRIREHEAVNRSLAILQAEFSYISTGFSMGELIDALTTAQYDLPTARGLCQDAKTAGVPLAEWLARIAPEAER